MSEDFIRTHVFSISLQAFHSTNDYEMWRVHHHFIVLLLRQRPALESISVGAKYVKEIDRTTHILPAHRSADTNICTVEAPVDIKVKTTGRVVDHPPPSSSSPPRFVFAASVKNVPKRQQSTEWQQNEFTAWHRWSIETVVQTGLVEWETACGHELFDCHRILHCIRINYFDRNINDRRQEQRPIVW